MKERHIVRRLVPVDFLDLDGIELWLEDMAAKGLHFQKFGTFLPSSVPATRLRSAGTPSLPRSGSGTRFLLRCWTAGSWAGPT